MRIGIDTHAAEQDGSGNCTYIRKLVEQLIKIDQKNDYVLFVTDSKHPFYTTLPKSNNFQIHPIWGKPSWFRVFFSLPAAAFREKVDLLHVQYFAPLFYRGRLVVTIHDLIPFRHPEHFSFYERMLFRSLLPRSARLASRILTVSNTSKKDLIDLLNIPADKIAVTYDGVDSNFCVKSSMESDTEILKRYGLDGDFFLSVGRIDSRKNLGRLIEAFDQFKRVLRLPHKLAIVGKVYFERDALMARINSLESADGIVATGYVPDQDLLALYRSATALVLISEYEGFGLPALEAMSCGTPVIASDIPVFREILNESCFFVNPLNTSEIAAAMQKFITDSEVRESFRQKGLELVAHFTWGSTAHSTLEAYSSVLQKKR